MSPTPRQRRTARLGIDAGPPASRRGPSAGTKQPITVDAIISINERAIIQTVNPAAERMFGYKAE